MSDYSSSRRGDGGDKGKYYLSEGLDLKKYLGRVKGWPLTVFTRIKILQMRYQYVGVEGVYDLFGLFY